MYSGAGNTCASKSSSTCARRRLVKPAWATMDPRMFGRLESAILRMISFFPNQQWQRLQPDFAYTMYQERMPFKWIIADLTISDEWGKNQEIWVFTIKAAKRSTLPNFLPQNVEEILQCHRQNKTANISTIDSSVFLTGQTEIKDIPAEFYWDDCGTWKLIEKAIFEYQGRIHRVKPSTDAMLSTSVMKDQVCRSNLQHEELATRRLNSENETLKASVAAVRCEMSVLISLHNQELSGLRATCAQREEENVNFKKTNDKLTALSLTPQQPAKSATTIEQMEHLCEENQRLLEEPRNHALMTYVYDLEAKMKTQHSAPHDTTKHPESLKMLVDWTVVKNSSVVANRFQLKTPIATNLEKIESSWESRVDKCEATITRFEKKIAQKNTLIDVD
ncbi:unnamed protein product, partial [Mesorhabditis belari]|uniref:Uncharacterized protein n=1 Tax=Mesorhabditis belari TaxID=2138241 RepID=A0AAF3EHP6_9BILA